MFSIGIAGIPGVGKSTLAEKLGQLLNAKVFYEPAGRADKEFNPYLQPFLNDMEKYSFGMQVWMLKVRTRMMIEANRHLLGADAPTPVVLDSLLAGDLKFAKTLVQMGRMTELDYRNYLGIRDLIMSMVRTNPNFVLYLNCPVEKALEYIGKRGRPGEDTYERQYFTALSANMQMIKSELEHQGSIVIDLDATSYISVEEAIERLYAYPRFAMCIAGVVFLFTFR